MSDPKIGGYFGVRSSNPFSTELDELTGNSGKFVIGNLSQSTSKNLVVTRDARGEFVPSSAKSVGETTNINMTLNAIDAGTISGLKVILGRAAATAITQMTINTQAGQFATVSVTGHKHEESGAVHNGSIREVEIPDFAGFGASSFGISAKMGVAETELQSASLQIAIEHKDEINKTGGFLCGTSYGLTLTLNLEAISEVAWNIDASTGIPSLGWTVQQGNILSGQKEESNTTHTSRRITLVKHLSFDYDGAAEVTELPES